MNDQQFKADGGKPRPTLFEKGFPNAIDAVQATLDYGAKKYEAHSWKNVPNAIERYDDAARRHRKARDRGEDNDAESGLAHLAHEIVCNLFLLELLIAENPHWEVLSPNEPPQDHKKKAGEPGCCCESLLGRCPVHDPYPRRKPWIDP